ncbi:MAG: hypothetical protein ACXWP0_03660 [Ktedonobacterales bacterium]
MDILTQIVAFIMARITVIALLTLLLLMVIGCAYVCVLTWQSARLLRTMEREGRTDGK